MVKRKKILLGILLAFSILLTIGIPIGALTYFLKYFGQIDTQRTFIYAPQTLKAVENFSVNCEIGIVEIQYVYPPGVECAKICLDVKMLGRGLKGKSIDDYLLIEWENVTSSNLSISCRNSTNPSNWQSLVQKVTIKVYLRADVIFNINTSVNDGDLHLQIPFGVQVNNVTQFVSNGDMKITMRNCQLNGILKSTVGMGQIEWYCVNSKFTNKSSLHFLIEQGDFLMNIYQTDLITSNVSGNAYLYSGNMFFYYFDNTNSNGAAFYIPIDENRTVILPDCMRGVGGDCNLTGFDYNPTTMSEDRVIKFISYDLQNNLVSFYYNFTLNLFYGYFEMDLNSF